ncbi:MAG: hypothetical protein AAF664_20415, partial [Planctomycetota bacterium]
APKAKSATPSEDEFVLRYQMQPGETLIYEVTHVGKTKTRVSGEEETSNFHTVSHRRFDVNSSEDEKFTFDHVIAHVEMTQQTGDADELRWDSESGEEAPSMFKQVASQIGETLATIQINPRGQQVEREDFGGSKANLGMGELTLAFPDEPVSLGGSWSIPREIKVRTPEGEVKEIKIQERYTLKTVKTGVATIEVRSEPITPIFEESIKAQVVQQLSDGKIRFDIDAGQMLSKELSWDETVVGFQGANSLMEYRARMTERLVNDESEVALFGPASSRR